MPGDVIQQYGPVYRVSRHADAFGLLARESSAIVVVHRSVDRAVLFQCPSGCGDTLVINLDPRAGAAWQLREPDGEVTLMPSVWRTTGCFAHFVLWRSGVWWCRFDDPHDLDDLIDLYDVGSASRDESEVATSEASNPSSELPSPRTGSTASGAEGVLPAEAGHAAWPRELVIELRHAWRRLRKSH